MTYDATTQTCPVCAASQTVLLLDGEPSTLPCSCGGVPPVQTFARPGHQPGSEQKILAHLAAFNAAGWRDEDLWTETDTGYKGLAYRLRERYTLGRVWTWCCELITPLIPGRAPTALLHWRTAPEAALTVLVGLHVRPEELKGMGI